MMLSAISAHLVSALTGLGIFGSVQPPGSEQSAYPVAQVFLLKDTGIQDKPSVTRQLIWGVQISSYDQNAPDSILELIDKVRDLLSGKRIPGHGHLEMEVPVIELSEYKHPGRMVYVVQVRLTVFPETFSLTS